MNAVEGRKNYLHQQIGYHAKQITILQEELDELEARDEAPEVEVTYADAGQSSPLPVEVTERRPAARRSGAKNLSDPKYQDAFISEARHHMGQPDLKTAQDHLGQLVVLHFNVDWTPAKGVLTDVVERNGGAPYLLLDDYRERAYPLNAIERIEVVHEATQ